MERGEVNKENKQLQSDMLQTTQGYNYIELAAHSDEGIRSLYFDQADKKLVAIVGDRGALVWDLLNLAESIDRKGEDDAQKSLVDELNDYEEENKVEYREYDFPHQHSFHSCGEAYVLNSQHLALLIYSSGPSIYSLDTSTFIRRKKTQDFFMASARSKETEINDPSPANLEGESVSQPQQDGEGEDEHEEEDDEYEVVPDQHKYSFLPPRKSFPVCFDKTYLVYLSHSAQYKWTFSVFDYGRYISDESAKETYLDNKAYEDHISIDIQRNAFLALWNGFTPSNVRLQNHNLIVVINNSYIQMYDLKGASKQSQAAPALLISKTSPASIVLLDFLTILQDSEEPTVPSIADKQPLFLTLCSDSSIRIYNGRGEMTHVMKLQQSSCRFHLHIPYTISNACSLNEKGEITKLVVIYSDDVGVHRITL